MIFRHFLYEAQSGPLCWVSASICSDARSMFLGDVPIFDTPEESEKCSKLLDILDAIYSVNWEVFPDEANFKEFPNFPFRLMGHQVPTYIGTMDPAF